MTNRKRMNISINKNGHQLQASWIFLMNLERCFKISDHGQKIHEFDFNRGLELMKRIQASAKKYPYITLSGNMINEIAKEDQITHLFKGGKISLGV